MLPDHLSTTYAALADPTRRAILARLAAGEATVGDLAEPFPMSLPAVSKHLKVLERAGLITRGRKAQWRPCRLDAGPLKDAAQWLEHYRHFWDDSFDRLDAYLGELQSGSRRMAITADAAALSAERELVITRIFDAPRRLVFKMWTEPGHLARWWVPRGFATISSRMDVRPGGSWLRSMRAPDGSLIRKHGIYREIVAPERLVFTYVTDDLAGNLGSETLVTVTFADLGGKTRLTLHQAAFQSVAARDDHRGGWTGALERFASYLSANAA